MRLILRKVLEGERQDFGDTPTVLCAAQTSYMFLVDDIAREFLAELQSFGQK